MTANALPPFPPHLSTDDYLTFIEESFRTRDRNLARRQKELEEQIKVRFDFGTEKGAPA